jgi:2',3'-cyclic-nucleotide 2'-phosphodiesterase (5'-nucleotidase family)
VPAGTLKKGVLHEILPFDNQVLALDVPGETLRLVMESSVANLSREGEAIADPPGNFLNIAGGTMEVDCSKPGGPSCVKGSTCRVTKLMVGTRDVLASSPDNKYRLAITDFLVNLGAGVREYLRGLDSNPAANPARASQVDSNLAEDYMRKNYSVSVERGLRLDPARTRLLNCAIPPKPAG